jgi:hypothetical protein
MGTYTERVAPFLRNQPPWLQYLILPLLVPFVPLLARFTLPATLIFGAIFSTLKYCGLLPPEYTWPAIIHLSTVCFWWPIICG